MSADDSVVPKLRPQSLTVEGRCVPTAAREQSSQKTDRSNWEHMDLHKRISIAPFHKSFAERNESFGFIGS